MLLPLNYLVNNTGDGSKYPLAESSLHVLLILIHYQKSILSDESMTDKSDDSATSESVSKVHVFSSGNTFTKALANARDVECEFFLFFIFLTRVSHMCMSKLLPWLQLTAQIWREMPTLVHMFGYHLLRYLILFACKLYSLLKKLYFIEVFLYCNLLFS